jgi:dTDP-4-amino-4,6-dideoxygalactose transaminase
MKRYRRVSVGHYETALKARKLIDGVLDSGRISYGPLCKELEQSIARMHGTSYGVLSASGTDSLRAALHAMKLVHGWNEGDEVITAATTFVATVNIILQVGLKPVLVDVIGDHYTMNPYEIEDKITNKTRAVIPVNLLGQAADLAHIVDIAQNNDLKVIEDSCEAMYTNHHGMPVGSWGDIGCFSFYMAHLVTAGVGGIAITDNREYEDVMRSLLNHGRDTIYISIDDDDELTGEDLDAVIGRRFRFVTPGYSSRMTELQAALALAQVDVLPQMIRKRNDIASALTRRLSKHSQLSLPYAMENNLHSWMMYGLSVKDGSKWPLMAHLEENNIETRELLPLINQPVYRGLFDEGSYPVSEYALDSAFYIGCHQGMDEGDVEYVGEVVDYFYGG